MDERIEEKREERKERIKVLQTLQSGTARMKMYLYISELDRRRNKSNLPNGVYAPRLSNDEFEQLSLNLPYWGKQYDWDNRQYRYQVLSNAIVHIERAKERLERSAVALAQRLDGWEMAEQLETAINVALSQIPDKEKRTATAIGIAKHLQLQYYAQSVDDDGLLIITRFNKSLKRDASLYIFASMINYKNAVGVFKAAIEATLYAMKKWGLWFDMSASRAYIRRLEQQKENYNIAWTRYCDKPSMYSPALQGNETPKELHESGQPLLYEPYRSFPKYSDIPADKDTVQIVLKYYIGYEETEPDKK